MKYDVSVEEFDKLVEKHVFSKHYMKNKKRILNEYRKEHKTTRWWNTRVIAVAAGCLALVAGGIFVGKILSLKAETKPANRNESQSSIASDAAVLSGETTDTTRSTETELQGSVEEKKQHKSIYRDACQFSSAKGDMAKIYGSTEELEKEADLIVVGTVVRQENYYMMSTMIGQYAWIEVEEVRVGNAVPGEEILIFQMGGYATYKEWVENTEFEGKPGDGSPTVNDDQIMAFGLNGYYPVVTGDKVLLYLQEMDDPNEENKDKIYYPVGDYFGVFYWSEDRNQFVFPQPYFFDTNEGDFWMEHLKNNPIMTVDV